MTHQNFRENEMRGANPPGWNTRNRPSVETGSHTPWPQIRQARDSYRRALLRRAALQRPSRDSGGGIVHVGSEGTRSGRAGEPAFAALGDPACFACLRYVLRVRVLCARCGLCLSYGSAHCRGVCASCMSLCTMTDVQVKASASDRSW